MDLSEASSSSMRLDRAVEGFLRRDRQAVIGALLLLTSLAWVYLITARFIDRIGKGIRGAPRDALIGDLAPSHLRGACYGLRQSLDTVGAFAGPLRSASRSRRGPLPFSSLPSPRAHATPQSLDYASFRMAAMRRSGHSRQSAAANSNANLRT